MNHFIAPTCTHHLLDSLASGDKSVTPTAKAMIYKPASDLRQPATDVACDAEDGGRPVVGRSDVAGVRWLATWNNLMSCRDVVRR